jgi:hypothetical protein
MEIEKVFGTFFKTDFKVLVVVFGSYETVCTTDCWHEFRGTKQVVQQYRFDTNYEAYFGIVLV